MADFEVGDRLLHPRYGPGTLMSVKKMRDDGEVKEYYVIELTRRKGRLLTPVEQADEVGLHSPGSKEDREDLWEVLAREPKEMTSDFRKRRKEIRSIFRSGSLTDMGRVVRDLAWRQAEGEATTGDRRLLDRAKDLLAEELVAMGSLGKAEAMERVESVLEETFQA
jgi:CarD family transcriptional regulator